MNCEKNTIFNEHSVTFVYISYFGKISSICDKMSCTGGQNDSIAIRSLVFVDHVSFIGGSSRNYL